jgi:hypothetical protein
VWERGRFWFKQQYERGLLGTPYTADMRMSAAVTTETFDKAEIAMIRRPQGDSVYFKVDYKIQRDPLNQRKKYVSDRGSISESEVARLARQLSYIAHTGVDQEEFERRAATVNK